MILNGARQLLLQAVHEMVHHHGECPYQRGVLVCRRGLRWHVNVHCSSTEGRNPQMQDELFACVQYSQCILPPDLASSFNFPVVRGVGTEGYGKLTPLSSLSSSRCAPIPFRVGVGGHSS